MAASRRFKPNALTPPEGPATVPTPLTGRAERLRAALEWERFEAWCAANGLRCPPVDPAALTLVALYVTHLAATGRNATTVARALVRDGDREAKGARRA